MALHIQYAHDSRQKRVGGKTAAAPNKGCSTPRMLPTADRPHKRARSPRAILFQHRCITRVYVYANTGQACREASQHSRTHEVWLMPLFFWPRVPLSHSCVSVRREVRVSIRCNVRAYVPVYGCVARVPPSLLRVRVHATHVYTMPRLREWRQMMTISPIFRGV